MNYRKSIYVKGEKIFYFEMTNNWYLVAKSAKVDFEIKKIKETCRKKDGEAQN